MVPPKTQANALSILLKSTLANAFNSHNLDAQAFWNEALFIGF